jgi:hypothetical protein
VRNSSIVTLNGTEYEVTRAKLRVWLQLEDIHEQIARAADNKDREEFTALIYSYLSTALSVDIDFSTLPWYEVVDSYMEIVVLHRPFFDFPFLKSAANTDKVPWDYEGRTWYMWSHMLSKEYGWQLEYIAEMDVDDAIAHLQEIATSEQMQREWEWMLSDKSVTYDKRGKGKFNDLHRPTWMGGKEKRTINNVERVPIKKSMLPVGDVVRWIDDERLDA